MCIRDRLKAIAEYAKHDRAEFVRVVAGLRFLHHSDKLGSVMLRIDVYKRQV